MNHNQVKDTVWSKVGGCLGGAETGVDGWVKVRNSPGMPLSRALDSLHMGGAGQGGDEYGKIGVGVGACGSRSDGAREVRQKVDGWGSRSGGRWVLRSCSVLRQTTTRSGTLCGPRCVPGRCRAGVNGDRDGPGGVGVGGCNSTRKSTSTACSMTATS
eukprot:223449-Pelagomonas_calceolata.AAC.1